MKTYWFEQAYLPTGWTPHVQIAVTQSGQIADVAPGANPEAAIRINGLAMPGFPNCHSHAFQRAMSGLTEVMHSSRDTFWTWRNAMYDFANAIGPDEQRAIANQLYMEMVKAGYTSVAEFHYLHHHPNGLAYDNFDAMSQAIIQAAVFTGINLTLLPVLYMSSNFGNQPLKKEQARFANTLQSYERLLDMVKQHTSTNPSTQLGMAFHSLRAVPPEAISHMLAWHQQQDPTTPIHIHVAEQQQEVEESLRWYGKRPVEWLLETQPVDHQWCLIHATHLNDEEIAGIANSGAIVGLCPTTEANLGDGAFPMRHYLQHGGRFAIGSDSNTSVSPIEELRWLEYGQRLLQRQRNLIASEQMPHTGQFLIEQSLQGGAAALGQNTGKIAPGCRADILVLDSDSPALCNKPPEYLFDSLVFSGNRNPVRDVMAGGNWVVTNYRHIHEETISESYRSVLGRLPWHHS